jgi:hypothetical protein
MALVRVEVGADGVAVVTLDRPEAMNALSRALRSELAAVMRAMDARAEVVVIRVATDVKLGDRNALILHGWSAVWSSVDAPRYVERVLPDHTGYMGIDEVSSVGIAWQYSSRNFDLRLGVGVSTLPYVWLADSVELAWRFGGPRIPSKTAAARPSGSVGANG